MATTRRTRTKETPVLVGIALLLSTLERMAEDAAKYPQLRLPAMQQARLDAALRLLRGTDHTAVSLTRSPSKP